MACREQAMPMISVIMGAYNCEKTIEKAIDSIIAQTYTNWEFIICDDGSTDHTLSVLEKYAERDARIKVLHNEVNLRLAASLNRCLAIARGKYIARMDSDDVSAPERLGRQLEFLEEHPEYAVVGCNRIVFDDDGSANVRVSPEYPDKKMLLKNPPYGHPTILMRKSVYDELEGYVVSDMTMRAEDLELWFRFYQSGFRGYNLQENLYYYRESETDFEKRSVRAAVQTSRVYLQGYKRIGIPWYLYFWALKPVVAALVPKRVMFWYHRRR